MKSEIVKLLDEWCIDNKLIHNIDDDWIVSFEGHDRKFILIESKPIILEVSDDDVDDGLSVCLSDGERDLSYEKAISSVIFRFGGKFYYSNNWENNATLTPLKYIGIPYIPEDLERKSYCNLGMHSGFELLNGSRNPSEWIKKTKFLGYTSIGICDSHTLSGVLNFQKVCVDNDIKPIIGETITVKNKNDDFYEIKLYVKNPIGWRNLLEINSIINIDNFSENTKFIKEEDILDLGEHLICVLSCHGRDIKEEYYKTLRDKGTFSDVFLQIDTCEYRSNDTDLELLETIQMFIEIDKNKTVLINDSFYLDQDEGNAKMVLNKIDMGRALRQSNDQYYKDLDDCIYSIENNFKSDKDLWDLLDISIKNTNFISESCNFTVQIGVNQLPKYKMTESEHKEFLGDREKLLRSVVLESFKSKVPEGKLDEYTERLEEEIRVIKLVDSFDGNGLDYFLTLWDVCRFCKDEGILTGIGRGSAGGTLLAYLLDITKIDPIKYNLLFERFLTEGRVGRFVEDDLITFSTEDGEFSLWKDEKVSIDRKGEELFIEVSEILEGDKLLI